LPCFREGKPKRLEAWLAGRGETLRNYEKSWFYSDSHNDLPLMQLVTHPVAVDPDDTLRAHAEAAGWPVMSLG
jgi:phosphoserine phosphatase